MAARVTDGLVVGFAAGLIVAELLRPLRRQRHSKLRRAVHNTAIGGLGAATVQLAELPIVMPLARYAEQRGWGILPFARVSGSAATIAALIALDYTLYWWHVLVHRVPGLWRFHVIHHADRDLDALTAIRFHFGELIASVPWRVAQVVIIGVTPRALGLWQTLTLVSILFHHSNVRLPLSFERAVGWLLVTPRLHGIHHSRIPDQMNSNWSSGLSVWDRLHGTFRDDVPQGRISVGVSGFDNVEDVRLGRLLTTPFSRHGRIRV